MSFFEKLGFEIIKTWTTQDARKNREDEKWLNIIVKRLKNNKEDYNRV